MFGAWGVYTVLVSNTEGERELDMLGIITMVAGGLVLVMLLVLLVMFMVDTVEWTRRGIETYRAGEDDVREWDRFFDSL